MKEPISFHDPADLPQASCEERPEDRCLEAWCDRCSRAVDAVCPKCKGNVSPEGVGRKLGTRGSSSFQDGGGSPLQEGPESSLSRAEFYRRFVNLVQGSRNTRFTLGCYLIATGDAYADGVTMDEFGKEWSVTRACVSKHCVFICEYLGIAPSQYMMKEAVAARFRETNRRPGKAATEIPTPKAFGAKLQTSGKFKKDK